MKTPRLRSSQFDSAPFAMRELDVDQLLRARSQVMLRADFLDEILETDDDAPELTVSNGVGVIRLHGAIGYGLAGWEKKYLGMIDIVDVTTLLDQAISRGDIRAVLLHCSSPGGTVMGITEAAARIYEARASKPIVAYAKGFMASSCYWLASQASAVYGSRSALIGSIGVYSALWDTSAAAAAAGYTRVLVSSAPRKGLPQDGLKIDDAQLAAIRERVLAYAAMFTADVQRGRAGTVQENAFDGGEWIAQKAAARGLIDDVIDSENEAMAEALKL